jgi:anion-transporting  ArsA/GET3 family ATPase
VAAAPGARELVTLGKLADLAGVGPDGHAAAFDLVVVDGPATGHAIGMIEAPGAVGDATPAGPVRSQAHALGAVLRDPEKTGFVGVSLPEPMSVNEVCDLDAGLRAALGRGLDLIVVDGVVPDRFSDAEAAAIEAAGRRCDRRTLTDAVLDQHRQARRHAAEVRRLRAHARAPVVTLPFLYAAELSATEWAHLARLLRRRLEAA